MNDTKTLDEKNSLNLIYEHRLPEGIDINVRLNHAWEETSKLSFLVSIVLSFSVHSLGN